MVSVSWLLLAILAASVLAGWLFHARGLRQGRALAEPALLGAEKERQLAVGQAGEARDRVMELERASEAERERTHLMAQERSLLQGRVERLEPLLGQLEQARADLDRARAQCSDLGRSVATLEVRLEEQRKSEQQRQEDLDRMKAQFQSMASEILEDKSRRFKEQNAEQLGVILSPLREEIGGFRKLVNETYEKEGQARNALQYEVKQVLELNRRLSDEARSLTRALTTENRTQGYWGELKLERLLESAGLKKGSEYLTQESYQDLVGDRYRPDAVLLLPEGRNIIVDAKMALLDYQRACDASDDDEREQHLSRHATALRTHMRQLGDKDYSRLEGLNSPDLVLMFVPVEGAFLEALRRDPKLWDDAFQRKIILVGPGNLLASLRLISQIWRTEQQNRNARAIADRAALLYDKFVGFAEDMGKVGEAIRRADLAHRGAVDKLSQGRGNLVRQAEMLRELGVSPSKRLPASLQDVQAEDGDAAGDSEDPLI